MKNRTFLIGCLMFPIIAIAAFWIGLTSFKNISNPSQVVTSDSWLCLDPTGEIPDYNEVEEGFGPSTISVQELCDKIKYAASDNRIQGIILRPRFISVSMPGMNEIGIALQEFKRSKKPVYGYLDMQSQKDYLLCSYANKVYMEPSTAGGIFLPGVEANITFYKNLLDKLGLKVNIVKSGTYKGYGETYSQTALSPGTYGNMQAVLQDRYSLLLGDLAKRRNLSVEQVRAIFESRADYIVSADYALEAKLIDAKLGYDDFIKENKIIRKRLLKASDYIVNKSGNSNKAKIAVVYLQGNIVSQSPGQMNACINATNVQEIIEQIQKNTDIKAIVLRVNSPGGSALESEIIFRKLAALKAKYPIVVSMSGTAASGGYYISAASDYIVADPYTVTGSIGVIQLVPDASELSTKIGISDQTIGFGKYAGAMNLWNSPSPELLASLQRNSTQVYKEFKQRVATGRKLDVNTLDNIAEGRVWSAQAALQNKLIDQIGSLDDAIKKAAQLAKLSTYSTMILPNKKPFWSTYLDMLYSRISLKSRDIKLNNLNTVAEQQLISIFQPYQPLCIMPYDLEL